jgi:hypothetical protein
MDLPLTTHRQTEYDVPSVLLYYYCSLMIKTDLLGSIKEGRKTAAEDKRVLLLKHSHSGH